VTNTQEAFKDFKKFDLILGDIILSDGNGLKLLAKQILLNGMPVALTSKYKDYFFLKKRFNIPSCLKLSLMQI